jgi:hypothetical protein
MSLFEYQKMVQRLAREQKLEFLGTDSIVSYINVARREVAMRTQCVRRLTPIGGAISAINVVSGGSGYGSTTISISAPDFPTGGPTLPNGAQATATPVVVGGVITSVQLNYGGAGYFQPIVTAVDGTGTGAVLTATVPLINTLNQGQEVYPFSSINVSMFPGVDSVYYVRSASVIYANYRYSLPMYPFSTYQAMIRKYPFQYQYVPAFCSQFGQGTDGSFYAYPIPSQTYQWEFDCQCIPSDLTTDQDVDVIPRPWSDAVPFYALHLAFMELQNYNIANYYEQQFDKRVQGHSNYARAGRMTNPYGRY